MKGQAPSQTLTIDRIDRRAGGSHTVSVSRALAAQLAELVETPQRRSVSYTLTVGLKPDAPAARSATRSGS